jgi:16S rRNA (cytosine967-C5)-methyltransferase
VSAVAPARACAYAVLRRVFEDGAYTDLALRSEARELDARDRALAMRLAYGAVQRRGTLDHFIAQLAERPAERLDAALLAALRLGLYELLYLGGAPDHAVVADAVELSKGAGAGAGGPRHPPTRGGHGLVNAVLRRATREGRALLEQLDDHTPERAAIMHSHPKWIARMWWEELGPAEARALLAVDNEPAELALRANTLVTDAPMLAAELRAVGGSGAAGQPWGVGGRRVAGGPRASGALDGTSFRTDPVLPEALVVEGPFDVHRSPRWRAGEFIAQSRAAMLPARILGPQPQERVLDLCAAPGGKTTHLAALMEDRGEVLAVEHNPRRAAELQRTAERLRATCVRVALADATKPLAGEGSFDRVLVDPPCSGLGTLQARADLRWRVTPERVRGLEDVQRAVLATAAAAVRPGGVLVYSTCTISPSENERQIFAFLESNPQFLLDDLGGDPAVTGTTEPVLAPTSESASAAACAQHRIGSPVMDGRAVLTLPHRDHTAGFFIARLRRA